MNGQPFPGDREPVIEPYLERTLSRASFREAETEEASLLQKATEIRKDLTSANRPTRKRNIDYSFELYADYVYAALLFFGKPRTRFRVSVMASIKTTSNAR
ncbi:MAG TPA: hypothetical protein DCY45_02240 [Mesotoga sp.]|nr:hypothetical protein [Mesotoga sp.]